MSRRKKDVAEDLPYFIFDEVCDKAIRPRINKAILGIFKKRVRENYFVSEFIQMPSGKWIVKLQRTMESCSSARQNDK